MNNDKLHFQKFSFTFWFVIICLIALCITIIGVKKKINVQIIISAILIVCGSIIIGVIRNIMKKNKKEKEKWIAIANNIMKTTTKQNRCNLYTGFELYRLGDMVRTEWRWKDKEGGEKYHLEHFPNSIASEYIRKTKIQKDYDVLLDIIKNRTLENAEIPNYNDIVIHLRIGDVVETHYENIIEILSSYTFIKNNKLWPNYTAPLVHLHNKIKKVDKENVGKLVFVAGSHINEDTPKSCDYIQVVSKYFESIGYNVNLRLGRDPDEDFIFMCNSRYFIPACNGGYTKLIKTIVTLKGNIVL